jgi:hypothetical protein
MEWVPSLPPEPEPAAATERAPAPAAAALAATEVADAPDIDLGELAPDSLLPDDLDFSLSLPAAPPPERAT